MTCGHDVIPWATFYDAAMACGSGNHQPRGLRIVAALLHVKYWVSRAANVDISDIVATTRVMMATDPRDRVYALLGLCTDVHDDSVLWPDYSQSTTTLDVYRNLIVHSIEEHSNLDLICMRRRYGRLDGSWPSWIPDWSSLTPPAKDLNWSSNMPQGPELFEGSCRMNLPWIDRYYSLNTTKYPAWMAAGATEAIATISKSPPVLHCAGICVDIIQDLGEPFLNSGRNWLYCDFSAWDKAILKNFGDCKSPEGDAIWHISDICGRLRYESLPSLRSKPPSALRKWLRRRARAQLQKKYPSKEMSTSEVAPFSRHTQDVCFPTMFRIVGDAHKKAMSCLEASKY